MSSEKEGVLDNDEIRLLERVVLRLIIQNELLLGGQSGEVDDLKQENERLRSELAAVKCQGIPGEIELGVMSPAPGPGQGIYEVYTPTVEDLRRLCDANGLVVLKKGQYICHLCGGVRTHDDCEFCKRKEV